MHYNRWTPHGQQYCRKCYKTICHRKKELAHQKEPGQVQRCTALLKQPRQTSLNLTGISDIFLRTCLKQWPQRTLNNFYQCMLIKQHSTYLIINNAFQRTTPNISYFAMFEQVRFIKRLRSEIITVQICNFKRLRNWYRLLLDGVRRWNL